MEDKLEKFIREHRADFDLREPDPKLWTKIEKNIRPKRSISWRIVASRAAAVLLIFIASYAMHDFLDKGNMKLTIKKQPAREELLIPELQEAEMYYSGIINEKLKAAEPIFTNCPTIEKELKTDMAQLDSIYNDLKKDLKDNIANQEVIEAIIENYRLRIALLEELLNDIKPSEGACISKINDYEL